MPTVVHITYSPIGGAGIAAGNLSEAVGQQPSWKSKLLSVHPNNLWRDPFADVVATATSAIDEFIVKKTNTATALSLFRKSSAFSSEFSREILEADIVHLHWVEGLLHGDFLTQLLARKPGTVFWSLHDMRPFTGACHFAGECQGFVGDCSSCPIVRPIFQNNVARNLSKRVQIMLELKPAFIAPGQWMKDKFSASSLKNLTCHMIPLALREESFVRTPKVERRTKLQLGFIAADLSDERKGLETAREQVRRLVRQGLEVNFEFVGSNPPENLAPWEKHLGFLTDGAISKWMAGLDFLVFTSLNDNTPLVIAESLASGTPILIASGTGADSMVDIGRDSLNILNATVDELKLEQSNRNLSTQASVSARRYNPTQVARNLVSLYEAAI